MSHDSCTETLRPDFSDTCNETAFWENDVEPKLDQLVAVCDNTGRYPLLVYVK